MRRKTIDMLQEYGNDGQKPHAHLDQFLRDQIMSQKSGRSKKSTVSASSGRKNNALIEMAAKNKY